MYVEIKGKELNPCHFFGANAPLFEVLILICYINKLKDKSCHYSKTVYFTVWYKTLKFKGVYGNILHFDKSSGTWNEHHEKFEQTTGMDREPIRVSVESKSNMADIVWAVFSNVESAVPHR